MTLRVGTNVDSWCAKCSLVLAHTILALVGSTVKKVECNTCKATHRFRATAPGTVVAKKPARVSKAKSAAASKRITPVSFTQNAHLATDYKTASRFEKGQWIRHTHFGIGIISSYKGDSKVEVTFESGIKTLVHGMTAPQVN